MVREGVLFFGDGKDNIQDLIQNRITHSQQLQIANVHILLTDETNRYPSGTTRFFVYGGLLFPAEVLTTLDTEIARIRCDGGYGPCDELKFDTRSRPAQVSQEAATEAKRRVLQLCRDCGCKFIVHVILHSIIAGQDVDQQIQWAADYVIGRFNAYLREVGDEGICIVDNLPNRSEFRYLSEKFCRGLTLDARVTVPLDHIKLFASTCVGASHAASAMDIVLGSFRYCINNPRNVEAAREMHGQVTAMMWHRRVGDSLRVRGRGLILRPEIQQVQVEEYRREYEDLIAHLRSLSVVHEGDEPG